MLASTLLIFPPAALWITSITDGRPRRARAICAGVSSGDVVGLSEQRPKDAHDAQEDDDPDDDDRDQKEDQEPEATAVPLPHHDHLGRWWGWLAHDGSLLGVWSPAAAEARFGRCSACYLILGDPSSVGLASAVIFCVTCHICVQTTMRPDPGHCGPLPRMSRSAVIRPQIVLSAGQGDDLRLHGAAVQLRHRELGATQSPSSARAPTAAPVVWGPSLMVCSGVGCRRNDRPKRG